MGVSEALPLMQQPKTTEGMRIRPGRSAWELGLSLARVPLRLGKAEAPEREGEMGVNK